MMLTSLYATSCLDMTSRSALQVWSDATAVAERKGSAANTPFYMGIYFCFGAGTLLIMVVRSAAVVVGTIKASRKLHADLLTKVCCSSACLLSSSATASNLIMLAKQD